MKESFVKWRACLWWASFLCDVWPNTKTSHACCYGIPLDLQLYFPCIKMHWFSNRVTFKREKVRKQTSLDRLVALPTDHVIQYLIELGCLRGGADKSLTRPTYRCRRAESIVSLERGVCSCAELQVFCCYRGWKEACQPTRGISAIWRRELSSSFIFKLPVRTATCIYLTFLDCNKFFCELNYRITPTSVLPRPGYK